MFGFTWREVRDREDPNLETHNPIRRRAERIPVFRHNLTWEEADQAVRELSARLFSLFVVCLLYTSDAADE